LGFDPTFNGVARYDATQHVMGFAQICPSAFGQFVNVVQKFRTMRNQIGPRGAGFVQSPFQARVTHVNC
jgi:hypothetical protein